MRDLASKIRWRGSVGWLKNKVEGVGRAAQSVKMHLAKLDEPCLIPGTHVVAGKTHIRSIVLRPSCMCVYSCTTSSQIHKWI